MSIQDSLTLTIITMLSAKRGTPPPFFFRVCITAYKATALLC